MNALWSTASFLSGKLIRTRGADSAVYLTFDDGPHPHHTVCLLKLLAEHDAKATFFLLGELAEQSPDLVRQILTEGHEIGNHSMTHPRMSGIGAIEQWAEIDRADAVLQRLDGRRRHLFRPPNGRLTLPAVAASLRRRQPLVLWTIDSQDYRLSPQDVVRRMQSIPPKGGDVILFHDDSACSTIALDTLLPIWKRAGLRFAALD